MELIDKDALLVEIDRQKIGYNVDGKHSVEYGVTRKIIDVINSLKVKEVDLEKEKDDYWNKLCDSEFGELIERDAKWFDDIAKYFYELGFKSRIDKELVEEVYSHLDSIKDTADRMTSGNFMHNRAAIKFSANTIAKVLELMGLKTHKGE